MLFPTERVEVSKPNLQQQLIISIVPSALHKTKIWLYQLLGPVYHVRQTYAERLLSQKAKSNADQPSLRERYPFQDGAEVQADLRHTEIPRWSSRVWHSALPVVEKLSLSTQARLPSGTDRASVDEGVALV